MEQKTSMQRMEPDEAHRPEERTLQHPGDTEEGPIPGDAIEGARPDQLTASPQGRLSSAEADAMIDELEADLPQEGSGTLGEGVHVGTPAGGTTRNTGSDRWGEPRES